MACLPLLILAAQFGPQTHSLLPKVRVGSQVNYDYMAEYSLGAQRTGFRSRYEMSVACLDSGKFITFQNKQREAWYMMGDKETKAPDTTTLATFRFTGALVSTEPAYASPEQARFGQLMQMIVPDGEVAVGSRWRHATAPGVANGQIGCDFLGQCLAFQRRRGIPCAKLAMRSRENGKGATGSCKMTVWFSLEDGLPVEIQMQLTQVPVGPGRLGNVKATNLRVQ